MNDFDSVIYVTIPFGVSYEIHCNESDLDAIIKSLPVGAEFTSYTDI